jgi:hypothetical protein
VKPRKVSTQIVHQAVLRTYAGTGEWLTVISAAAKKPVIASPAGRGNPVPTFATHAGTVVTTPWIAAGLRPSQ